MRFAQISSNDALTQAFIAAMQTQSPVLTRAEFYSIVGNAEYARKAAATAGGAMRAIDSDHSGQTVTPSFIAPALKIMGDKVLVDVAHERRGADVPSVRAAELLSFGRNLGRVFNDQFVNGTGLTVYTSGVKTLCVSGQKIYANSSSAALSIGMGNADATVTAQQALVEKLRELISMVRSGGTPYLILDSAWISRITTLGTNYVTITKDEFGKVFKYFDGVEMIDAGLTGAGAKVIAGDETHGTISGTCHSIYAVAFGERSDLSIATNVGLEIIDRGMVGSQWVHNAEFDLATALFDDKAIAKLEGLKFA